MEATSAGSGPKYDVNIEGTIHPWQQPTIDVSEIEVLGDFPPGQGVVEVDLKDNTERTLDPGETVTLQPGLAFAKKVLFKRG